MHRTALTLFLAAAGGLSLVAQTTSTGAEQQVHADMNQLMRGVLYPAANVVFSAQVDNPAEINLAPVHDSKHVDRSAHQLVRGLDGGGERGAGARRVGQLARD